MKLLLTSGGLANKTIVNALKSLVSKPFSKLKVAFIPTASNFESGDKWWLIGDLKKLQELGFGVIDIVDVSALPKEMWFTRLKEADILFVEGGNTHHLIYWFNKSGLSEVLPELLETRVYVGVSAGSMVPTPSIANSTGEREPIEAIGEDFIDDGLSLVDFMVTPHINNSYFPELTFDYVQSQAKKYSHPFYALDDKSAIKVDGDKVEVVSEGEWKKLK